MLLLLELPWHILVQILKHLTPRDIRNLILTCRGLRDFIIHSNAIWRYLYEDRMFIHGSTRNRLSSESVYHLCRLSKNWMKGHYIKKDIITHRTKFMPWMEYHSPQGLFLSVGKELWCYPTYANGYPNCRRTLWKLPVPTVPRKDIRTDDISRFLIKHDHIVLGNRDGCAVLYRLDNIREHPTLVRHIKDCHNNGFVEVSAVELVGSDSLTVITASECTTQVCFWDGAAPVDEFYQATKTIPIPNCVGVRCLATDKNEGLLAMGTNGNCKPLLLDINRGEVIMRAENSGGFRVARQRYAVRDIVWHDPNNIAYVSHSGDLEVIDTRTHTTVYSACDPFEASMFSLKTDNERSLVVGTSQYSRCVLFDIREDRKHAQMYFTQKKQSPVYCLDFDSRRLLAAADQGVALVNFDVNIGDVERNHYVTKFARY